MSTEHFTDFELACRCGCGGLPSQDFQKHLEALRVACGKPMRLSSCWRCPDYNDLVSKTGRGGPHTVGAADVLVFGPDAYWLDFHAKSMGWTGVGTHQKGPHELRYLHLDRLSGPLRPRVWSY